jgi:uncharacterized protein
MFWNSSMKNRALWALALIVPATSIGALSSALIAPGLPGQIVAIGCGLWMVLFPVFWQKQVERKPLALGLAASQKSLGIGAALGLGMFCIILSSYWFVGRHWLDVADIRARVVAMQMNVPLMVFGFGTFQTLVNSWIEEYVWRWFVYQKCEVVWGKSAAVWISAVFFTLHHVVLLVAYCGDWWLVVIGSAGVFIAGVIWARCFGLFRSIAPCYLSHLSADLALQIVSWHVLMG